MDSNKEWLKRARAKRIAKIQRKARIDRYIRDRVYMIIAFLLISWGVLYIAIDKISNQQEDMVTLHTTMGELLTKTANDKLLKQNLLLGKYVDSLQILLFAYNRRHQADAKTIQALVNGNTPKIIHNVPDFPDFIDSTEYDFTFDTITGTINNRNEILIDTNFKNNKNEENHLNDSNSVIVLKH